MVELLAVVVIMGILAAIAIPSWFGIIEQRAVDSAANQLVADLRLAHSSATNQLAPWRLVYNGAGTPVSGCGASAAADYCLLKMNGSTVVQSMPRSLPDNTKLRETNLLVVSPIPGYAYDRSLQFQPDGSTQTTGGLPLGILTPKITVSAEDNAPSHDITVNLATSRVRIDP